MTQAQTINYVTLLVLSLRFRATGSCVRKLHNAVDDRDMFFSAIAVDSDQLDSNVENLSSTHFRADLAEARTWYRTESFSHQDRWQSEVTQLSTRKDQVMPYHLEEQRVFQVNRGDEQDRDPRD
jgi:hypothetical protein